ncbi:MAG TPA: class I SAM-dependent methyltransferase [Rugosimonospora sp.]|nr:class I SAM-dependent methyltransferase [Rugosimonospora sp.]
MRLSLRADNAVEWLALRARLVPTPAAQAWGGLALSGALLAGVRTGLFARLAAGPAGADELLRALGLDPVGGRLLLDCLVSAGHLTRHGDVYRLTRASARWLDPGAPLSVTRFVAATEDYWDWWPRLPEALRAGTGVRSHDTDPDDGYWRRYITGQYELARLSAGEVARCVRVPRGARDLLDVGGGHGWYTVRLCRRHPRLAATVLDLPGSARVGRELVAGSDVADRVTFREGDALTADLGTGRDLVLCFNLLHHLDPEQIGALLSRIRAALAPGGTVAILDAFSRPGRRPHPSAAALGLFMYLSSGAREYTQPQLYRWLHRAGFGRPRRTPVRRIPGLAVYQAAVA